MASRGGLQSLQKECTDPDSMPMIAPLKNDTVLIAFPSSRAKAGYLKAIRSVVEANGDYDEEKACFIWNNYEKEPHTYYLTYDQTGETQIVCFDEKSGLILKKGSKMEEAFLFKLEERRTGIFSLRNAKDNKLLVVDALGKAATIKDTKGRSHSTAKCFPHPSSLCEIYIKEAGSDEHNEIK